MTTPLPDVSVVVATWNRSAAVRTALDSLTALDARGGVTFEIVVADNGSRDNTRAVVEFVAASAAVPVRYVLEPRRGVSYARNAGIAAATAPIVAFTDDDQDVAPDWLAVISRVFREHTDVDGIGGRVRPRWVHPPPPWITQSVWGPISIIDRGPTPFCVTRERWMCLPGGNMAWRRQALIDLGGFSPEYPRSQDRELTVRALLAGRTAMYVPDMIVYHHIDGRRLTKGFFRQWSRTEGRMRAGYAFEELFTVDGRIRPVPDGMPRALGVSRFMYRSWLATLRSYAQATLRGNRDEAFRLEMRALYLASYIHRRIDLTSAGDVSLSHRTGACLVRGLARATALVAGILQ
jgi:glucosyl-dolichyl phosphate glucuronosyltransferase